MLDGAGGPDGGVVGVLAELPLGATLTQQVPALVQLFLQPVQPALLVVGVPVAVAEPAPVATVDAMDDSLHVQVADGVLRLVLDRPGALNALDASLADRLADELEAAASRDEVRVVAITGAGDAFCAGADIGAENRGRLDATSLDRANRIIRAVVALPKPCVAVVNGVAAGVGCSLALACDLAMVADTARFVLSFSRIGLMPDGGATATVAASIGRARAMRMALLGEPMTATEAYDGGLVSHLVPAAELRAEADHLLARLATGPPLAFAATKKAVNAATLAGLERALERERTGQSVLLRTKDAAEGTHAFAERRTPRFTGD